MFEIPSLDGFVPDYRRILLDWLNGRFGLPRQPHAPDPGAPNAQVD